MALSYSQFMDKENAAHDNEMAEIRLKREIEDVISTQGYDLDAETIDAVDELVRTVLDGADFKINGFRQMSLSQCRDSYYKAVGDGK